jgi:hypothetical protein
MAYKFYDDVEFSGEVDVLKDVAYQQTGKAAVNADSLNNTVAEVKTEFGDTITGLTTTINQTIVDGDSQTLTDANDYTDNRIEEVQENSGTFIGQSFATKQLLDDFVAAGIPDSISNGDFTFVLNDESNIDHPGATTRYICWKDSNGDKEFKYEYTLNQNFNPAQMAAIDSTATEEKINSIANKVDKDIAGTDGNGNKTIIQSATFRATDITIPNLADVIHLDLTHLDLNGSKGNFTTTESIIPIKAFVEKFAPQSIFPQNVAKCVVIENAPTSDIGGKQKFVVTNSMLGFSNLNYVIQVTDKDSGDTLYPKITKDANGFIAEFGTTQLNLVLTMVGKL